MNNKKEMIILFNKRSMHKQEMNYYASLIGSEEFKKDVTRANEIMTSYRKAYKELVEVEDKIRGR